MIGHMNFARGFLFVAVLSACAIFTAAKENANAESDLAQKIKARAAMRTEILDLMKSDDPNVRISALEEAIKSRDPELRLSAMTAALSMDDTRLRKAAIRAFIDKRSELSFIFILPDDPEPGQKMLFDAFHGTVLQDAKVDAATDVISFGRANGGSYYSGQLVDDGVNLNYARGSFLSCVMKLRPAGATVLTGSLDCVVKTSLWLRDMDGKTRAIIPVKLNLS